MNGSNHWVPSLQSSTFYQAIDPMNIGQRKNRWGLKNKKVSRKHNERQASNSNFKTSSLTTLKEDLCEQVYASVEIKILQPIKKYSNIIIQKPMKIFQISLNRNYKEYLRACRILTRIDI